jgi:hypothetical protein
MARGASLRPLAKLPKLASLKFSAADGFRDYETLLAIPSLRELEILNLHPAMELVTKKKFADALALFDHLITNEYVDTPRASRSSSATRRPRSPASASRSRTAIFRGSKHRKKT